MPVPSMQDGCPWSELSHLAPPNLKWCEAQVCGWIVEPANTWSNLAYGLLGAALLVARRDRLARTFGQAQLAVGAFPLCITCPGPSCSRCLTSRACMSS